MSPLVTTHFGSFLIQNMIMCIRFAVGRCKQVNFYVCEIAKKLKMFKFLLKKEVSAKKALLLS